MIWGLKADAINGMIGVIESRVGVQLCLERLTAVELDPSQRMILSMSPPLRHDGGITVRQYESLPAVLASKVAAVTDNVSLIRWIAEHDRRRIVRQSLGKNPNLPRDVVRKVAKRRLDGALSEEFRQLRCMSVRSLLSCPDLSRPALRRILREARGGQLRRWAADAKPWAILGAVGQRSVTWSEAARLLAHLEGSRLVEAVTTAVSVPGRAIDWSERAWEPLLRRLAGTDIRPVPPVLRFEVGAAPAKWLQMALDTTNDPGVLRFALSVASPSAVAAFPAELFGLPGEHGPTLEYWKEIVARVDSRAAFMSASLESEYMFEGLGTWSTEKQEVIEALLLKALEVDGDYVSEVDSRGEVPKAVCRMLTNRAQLASPQFVEQIRAAPRSVLRGAMARMLQDLGTQHASWGAQPADVWGRYLPLATREAILAHLVPADITEYPRSFAGQALGCEFERRMPDASYSDWANLLETLPDWDGSLLDLIDTVKAMA